MRARAFWELGTKKSDYLTVCFIEVLSFFINLSLYFYRDATQTHCGHLHHAENRLTLIKLREPDLKFCLRFAKSGEKGV